jgi:hypothetical protein
MLKAIEASKLESQLSRPGWSKFERLECQLTHELSEETQVFTYFRSESSLFAVALQLVYICVCGLLRSHLRNDAS